MNTFPIPWYKKINPIWWLGNYIDPVNGLNSLGLPNHPDFYPTKPLWIRTILWTLRNPFNNFCFYVIGLEDKKDLVNYGDQWPKAGQKANIILPFFCYKGSKFEFYIGWRNGTKFGIALRNANSKPM